ncbi:MAG TPA: hypothetical protein PK370_01570 [Candidatus Woesebacteria bacterium]|nr:hypothetical protein [Candidatus Woesebacteria bacterium]
MVFLKRYPKLLLFFLSVLVSILVFCQAKNNLIFGNFLISLDHLGVFLGGVLYAYGFTAPIGTATLLTLAKTQNLYYAGLIGGLGALTSDIMIFLFVKHSFTDEVLKMKDERIVKSISNFNKNIFGSFNRYLVSILASVMILSPLPTEVGVTLLSSQKEITIKLFVLIAFLLHTVGIFIVLWLGR